MVGEEIYELAKELSPILTSISGPGLRKFLETIKSHIPQLEIGGFPSGSKCFDWTVPLEWKIDEAYIQELETGNIVVDLRNHNLHVVNYSIAIDQVLTFEELEKHLHYREDLPNAIPYITSYYNPYWGFCISYEQYKRLNRNSKYRVVIKSEHYPGYVNYGELYVPGKEDKEVVFSTYVCHPSMGNNELSGPSLTTFLAKIVLDKRGENRLSYRFLFLPETIGSICYISKNLERLKSKVIAGFVITCVGDPGKFSYIPSRYGNTLADKVALNLLDYEIVDYRRYTYLDRGSDERQYCSPGVDLPFCSITRTKYGEYKEYHTSLDDLNFITANALEESYNFYSKIIDTLENNFVYVASQPCEPQLGKRGLYHNVSDGTISDFYKTILDFLSYADGKNDLIDIANHIRKPAYRLIGVANLLKEHGLIRRFE